MSLLCHVTLIPKAAYGVKIDVSSAVFIIVIIAVQSRVRPIFISKSDSNSVPMISRPYEINFDYRHN